MLNFTKNHAYQEHIKIKDKVSVYYEVVRVTKDY